MFLISITKTSIYKIDKCNIEWHVMTDFDEWTGISFLVIEKLQTPCPIGIL